LYGTANTITSAKHSGAHLEALALHPWKSIKRKDKAMAPTTKKPRAAIKFVAGVKPTPKQIEKARLAAGLSQEEAAAFIYSSKRAWYQWETEPGMQENGTKRERSMHPALWELFLLKTEKLRE
jgi:DNA-binding transcriptional regulator YiaG